MLEVPSAESLLECSEEPLERQSAKLCVAVPQWLHQRVEFAEPRPLPLPPREPLCVWTDKASVAASGKERICRMRSSSLRASRIDSMVALGMFCCILAVTSNLAGRVEKTWILNAMSEMASAVPAI